MKELGDGELGMKASKGHLHNSELASMLQALSAHGRAQQQQPTLGDKRDAAHLASIEAKIRALGDAGHKDENGRTTRHEEDRKASSETVLRFAERHDSKDAALLAKLEKQLHHLNVEQDALADTRYVEQVNL